MQFVIKFFHKCLTVKQDIFTPFKQEKNPQNLLT